MGKYRIAFYEDRCVGCGNCSEVCPDNWALKGGVSHPLKAELEDIGCNRQASEECPESCIEIVEQ
ncbi:MAG: ferredoxin [Candidatus Hodarchaeota archaeon]